MAGKWLERSRKVCDDVIRQHGRPADPEALRALLNDHYPFGSRQYTPYKVWLTCLEEYCGPSPKKQEAQRKALAALMAKVGQGSIDFDARDYPSLGKAVSRG